MSGVRGGKVGDADRPEINSDRGRLIGLSLEVLRGRLLVVLCAWALLAFVVRPAMVQAHLGRGGWMEGLHAAVADPLVFSKLLGTAQWLSVMLLVAILAMAHIRLAGLARAGDAWSQRAVNSIALPIAYLLALFVGYLGFVWSPSTTLTTIAHDSFIFYDAIYRIGLGQRPHVDFHTALGAATLYLPALGAWISGGYAGSVEMASALVGLAAGLACCHAGSGRLPVWATAVFAALAFLIATPAVLLAWEQRMSITFFEGEPIGLKAGITYAMFYNRWGWAGLLPLLLYLLPRRDGVVGGEVETERTDWVAVAVMATLITFLFYTKANYVPAAVGAATIYALGQRQRWKVLAGGAGVAAALIVLIGGASGMLLPYLGDILQAAQVSGGRFHRVPELLIAEAFPLVLAWAPLAIAGLLGRTTARDWWICVFIAVASLYVMVQNEQQGQTIGFTVLAAYGMLVCLRLDQTLARVLPVAAFAVLMASPILDRSVALLQQTAESRREEIRPPAPWSEIPALSGVHLAERENLFLAIRDTKGGRDLIDAFHFANRVGRREAMRQGEYMATILQGMRELQPILRPGDSVTALDMANPFPFLMNARPAKGSYITLHDGRTVDDSHYPAPEDMFRDSDHVMIARTAVIQETVDLMLRVYDDWLTAHYEERVVTDYWIRYSRRKS